jgi:hypothetical protein
MYSLMARSRTLRQVEGGGLLDMHSVRSVHSGSNESGIYSNKIECRGSKPNESECLNRSMER